MWPVSSLLPLVSLAEWGQLIVRSEKAKPLMAFSSLISQVQSSSLWDGHYIWRKKDGGEEQQEVFTKDDNRSEVTKHGCLSACYVHTLMCY